LGNKRAIELAKPLPNEYLNAKAQSCLYPAVQSQFEQGIAPD